ncbi:MAG: 30S ribosome-binding factor RbfA [Lentisphaerae bacterium]|nr:30S ribosome-binding factor RbfA [Lentisphaerota bacterium]
MNSKRIERVNELLRREIGGSLFRLITEEQFDLSAVTVTHVVTAPNLRHARVLVSIRDHVEERDGMLSILKRHRKDIQDCINKNLTLKYTPRLSFVLDTSVEKGDNMLSLLSNLEQEEGDVDMDENDPVPGSGQAENTV